MKKKSGASAEEGVNKPQPSSGDLIIAVTRMKFEKWKEKNTQICVWVYQMNPRTSYCTVLFLCHRAPLFQ